VVRPWTLAVSVVAHAALLGGLALAIDRDEPAREDITPVAQPPTVELVEVAAVPPAEPDTVDVALLSPSQLAAFGGPVAPRATQGADSPHAPAAAPHGTAVAVAATTSTGRSETAGTGSAPERPGGTDLIGHMRGRELHGGDVVARIAEHGGEARRRSRSPGSCTTTAAGTRASTTGSRRSASTATATRTSTTSPTSISTCCRRCRRSATCAMASARR
jgi:hypothetical protein